MITDKLTLGDVYIGFRITSSYKYLPCRDLIVSLTGGQYQHISPFFIRFLIKSSFASAVDISLLVEIYLFFHIAIQPFQIPLWSLILGIDIGNGKR